MLRGIFFVWRRALQGKGKRRGREDEYGFGNVEKRLPQLKSVLGEDNVSVRIYDNLGHGFGIGSNTIVPHWFEEAVEFWEAHRK